MCLTHLDKKNNTTDYRGFKNIVAFKVKVILKVILKTLLYVKVVFVIYVHTYLLTVTMKKLKNSHLDVNLQVLGLRMFLK